MKQVTEQWIAAQAPNASALQNGRKIARSGGFVSLSRSEDGTFYMGECTGSGKSNYTTSADFVDPEAPVFRCSCPSRQFPCKHSLALLFEILEEKPFRFCEIPESILEKRAKKEARTEKKQEKKSGPPRVNQAARTKKLKKQMEGLELARQMTEDLLTAGLGTLGGKSVKAYQDLARQLGDHYLPGPQIYIKRIVLEIEQLQADGDDVHYREAVHLLTQLAALIKKARVYISGKLESGSVEDDDSTLYEELGGIWQAERLQQLGLCRENVRLAQLSFQVFLDKARGEYVDLGYWVDLDSGEIVTSCQYRPLKALKYVKQDDTVFDLLSTPLLTCYPGGMNRRVRWEKETYEPLCAEHFARIREAANPSLAPAVKAAKNEIKNTLSNGFAALTVAFRRIGLLPDGSCAMEDSTGAAVTLRDMRGAEPTVYRLSMLPDAAMLENQVLFGAFFYDETDRRICVQPYSIITENTVVRLQY